MAKSFLVDINLNQNEIQNATVQNLATDPASAIKGQMYFNTSTNRFRVFNGTTWDEMGTGGGTVTSVAAQNATDGGLTISGSPIISTGTLTIGHTNVLTAAKTTEAIYPVKIDKNGHISSVGTAFDPSTKQAALTAAQLNAVNSGITSAKVTTYDGYASGKQDALTDDQLAAVNSGITSSKVTTYDAYATGKQDTLDTQTAYTSKGSATKVPQITTNSLGQVTAITEVTITQPSAGTTASAVSTTASGGSATTWSKSDHVHSISGTTITSALGYTPYNSTNPNGYTSNTGTITQVSVNGTSVATSGSANITAIPASIVTKGALADGMTATTQSQGDNSTKLATTAYVDTAIDNLPEPMVFKGSLGTNGTITTLPDATSTNEGYTYKVITAGTYASQSAKVGDTFISDGSKWVLIPSGDEPSGTVTSVNLTNGGGLTISGGPITSSGSITVGHSNSVTAQTTQAVYPIKIDANGHISAYGTAVTILKKVTADITGDGTTTSFPITHSLGTRDVTIQVYDATSYDEVMVDIYRTSTSVATIEFATAPVAGKNYRVVIIG